MAIGSVVSTSEVNLVQQLARRRTSSAEEANGYAATFRDVEFKSDSDGTIRVLIEGIAQERSNFHPSDDEPVEMSVEIDDDSTQAEVECVLEVVLLPTDDKNVATDNESARELIIKQATSTAYPYIRQRLISLSREVFRQPLVLPVELPQDE